MIFTGKYGNMNKKKKKKLHVIQHYPVNIISARVPTFT